MNAPNRYFLKVAELERRAAALDTLCGEMLACLRVNLQRCTLTTSDDDQFAKMLDGWSQRRMNAITEETK